MFTPGRRDHELGFGELLEKIDQTMFSIEEPALGSKPTWLFIRGILSFDLLHERMTAFHFQNVERLIVRGGSPWHEGCLRLPNFDHELQARQYGQRTTFMGAGLACYYHGKSLVKNEPRLVQGLHTAMSVRPDYEVVRMTVPIDQGFVVHYPCITRQHFAHRLQRNKFRVPEVRKFRHETLLDTFLFGPGGHPDKADLMVTALHTCSVEEARRWSEAGLCRSMPTACLPLFEQAAGESDVLHLGFADRSFAEFYQG